MGCSLKYNLCESENGFYGRTGVVRFPCWLRSEAGPRRVAKFFMAAPS
jgi:hypothetical protein